MTKQRFKKELVEVKPLKDNKMATTDEVKQANNAYWLVRQAILADNPTMEQFYRQNDELIGRITEVYRVDPREFMAYIPGVIRVSPETVNFHADCPSRLTSGDGMCS